MEFIKEITEARMTRDSRNQKNLTYSDCCERLYLSLLSLEMMRNYPSASAIVQKYCKSSLHFSYKDFKISGTDVYNLMYFLKGNDETLGKLKDPGAAKRMQASLLFPIEDVKRYLSAVSKGLNPPSIQQMFMKLETGLDIKNTDYKGIRRSLSNYTKLNSLDKRNLATRLLYAMRAKLRNSDLIDDYSTLVAIKDLEASRVIDPEPTISKPDIQPSTDPNYIYYRLLAKPQNMILVKGFIEHVREGKPIPSNMVKAYAPVVKVIDDIVRAGPSYINMLKAIHNRAEKARKK
tara:strand:+ start:2547 stop:3419 length:873 start_codon:yes stop_codon:yes gene_type:complete